MVELGIKIRIEESGIVIRMAILTEQDAAETYPVVWANDGNRGGLEISPLKVKLKKEREIVCQRQYPISLEGKCGIKPVIEGLAKDGLLEQCMSPYNTAILPVKKPDGTYRLDLRQLNQIVQTGHPVVQNPYTLLSKIPHDHG